MNNLLKKIIFFMFPLIFLASNNGWAYTMPIGIPDANIDFEAPIPQRPSDWSQEVPGYYYVDLEAGSFSPEFGSEASPRNRIPSPIPAGSYVEIAGDYSVGSGGVIAIISEGNSEQWVASKSGPVWITTSPNKPSAFTEKKVILSGSDIFIVGMTFKDHSLLQVGSHTKGYSASNVVIRKNEIIGYKELASGSLLSALGHLESPTQNIIFYDNIIRDAGDVTSLEDLDAGLIAVAGYASDVWMLNNTGYNASGTGLQVNAIPPRTATHNVYAGRNEFYNVRQSGMWVKYAQNVVFSSNYIHDIITTSWSPAKGMGGQYEPDGLWMINNRIDNVEYGIRIPSTSDLGETKLKIYAIGNILQNINTEKTISGSSAWESAAIHIHGAEEHYILNNLILNAPNGVNISTFNGKSIIENNIILNLTVNQPDGQYGYHVWSEGKRDNDEIAINNNYFDSDMKIKLVNDLYETPEQLAKTGNLDNVYGPIFISNENITSTINSGSSNEIFSEETIDKGKSVSLILIAAFKSSFPASNGINLDLLSNDRFMGESIDIGPFEQDDNKMNGTEPAKPGNLQLTEKNSL